MAMTVTSFLGDLGYEMVTAVLPGFLATIGVAAAALGWIEGLADAMASFVKLGAGWYSDRIGRRKPIATLGYFLSGSALASFALAVSWPLILAGRVTSWLGRGIRGPLRDAMLAESVAPSDRGKAFGFHRAGDTAGAVVGPLLGAVLLGVLPASSQSAPFRTVFLISLIPGLASAACFAAFVRESRRPGKSELRLWAALRDLPKPYIRFLRGVGVFGLGDFAPTLLILAATQLLTAQYGLMRAAQIAALLYLIRNLVYAGVSFPIGRLADEMSKQALLATGYFVGSVTAIAVAVLFALGISNLAALVLVFCLSGIYIAAQDALEGAIPPDLVSSEVRGTAYGLMGAVNSVGDFGASALVGTLWTAISPVASFACAGALMFSGAMIIAIGRLSSTEAKLDS